MNFEPWKEIKDVQPKTEQWPSLCSGWITRYTETFLFNGNKVFVGRINVETPAGWEAENGEIVTHWTEFKKPYPPKIKNKL